MEIRKVPISLLNAAPYNPRKDLQPGDPEYQKIARSIEKYGCVEPIIWNVASNEEAIEQYESAELIVNQVERYLMKMDINI